MQFICSYIMLHIFQTDGDEKDCLNQAASPV